MSILKKIFQSKTAKNLFWTAFWGGNLMTIAILIFIPVARVATYNESNQHGVQVQYSPSSMFMLELSWGGFMFLVHFSWIVLSINLFFLAYLIILKKQGKKISYNFITIIMSTIIASILMYGIMDLYLRLYF